MVHLPEKLVKNEINFAEIVLYCSSLQITLINCTDLLNKLEKAKQVIPRIPNIDN
jgi:hypothetical protein